MIEPAHADNPAWADHPWQLPYSRQILITAQTELVGEVEVGCQVLPASALRRALRRKKKSYSPTFSDVANVVVKPSAPTSDPPGWRIEEFVADLILGYQVGYIAEKEQDRGLDLVFNRRAGPIDAAIAITFDAP